MGVFRRVYGVNGLGIARPHYSGNTIADRVCVIFSSYKANEPTFSSSAIVLSRFNCFGSSEWYARFRLRSRCDNSCWIYGGLIMIYSGS